MFDIGFTELIVVAVVALIVIGPERLPKAARTMGHLFGRLQRYVNDVKSDIKREIELDELRKLQQQVVSAAQDLKSSVESAARDADAGLRDVEQQLNSAASDPVPTPSFDAAPPRDLPAAGSPANAPSHAQGALPGLAPAGSAGPPPRQPSLPGFDKI